MSATIAYASTRNQFPDTSKITLDKILQVVTVGATGGLGSMIPTTRPRFPDTKEITLQKYLQCLQDGPLAGTLDKITEYPTTELMHADTKAIVLQKVLQECN